MKSELKITIENTELELKSGFAGGFMADDSNAPVGLYAGKMDIGELGMALSTLHRAVIKLAMEDLHMNLKQAESFLQFCTEKAIQIEKENKKVDNVTLQQHEAYIKVIKNSPKKRW